MRIMVSACLAGMNCKYNGGNNRSDKVIELMKDHDVITVCPEEMGGLPTPRVPSEIVNGVVTAKDGTIVDDEFRRGAQKCLEIAMREKPDLIILQSRSPSCGVKQRYDGTFSGVLTEKPGVTADLLIRHGFNVRDVNDPLEMLDICDEEGFPVGKTVERTVAHSKGILHRTAHVWIIRVVNGRTQVLLQKRSMDKDSYPGMYDTSSAGHIPAGMEPLDSALRELEEELGIRARAEELTRIGSFRTEYEENFYGETFHDNEMIRIFLYREPVDISTLTLQKAEVEEVRWFDLEEVYEEAQKGSETICVNPKGLKVLVDYLKLK